MLFTCWNLKEPLFTYSRTVLTSLGVWVWLLVNRREWEIFIVLRVQTTSDLLTYCFRSLDIEGRPRISWSREHGLSWPPWNNACFGALFVIVKFIVFDDSSVWTNTNRDPNNINVLNLLYFNHYTFVPMSKISYKKNKNILKTIEAEISEKVKNNEARPKFTGSYKKMRV